ncbi:Pex12 amino terminal region-domain-containing protein [Hypoxylon trugodes]|uniref:Pex12 amino terminal region-domain-containing protein n=1 Tax=Hypoxylon trugodes TaxID=326681 RepID=UPI0021928E7B|nr:Pex12 amino terminal region-domain-containing protein [Hypoxylon trugodes]KAI1394153.1 Pex12 amino terminal region-domain-containing protein [Hypoxylon trugodes]
MATDSPAPTSTSTSTDSPTPSSSTTTSTVTSSLPSSSPYPYAFAPDIIRAHQKDAYFQGLLTNQITDLHRRLLGARSAHTWATESRTLADLLYLCLTTLLGNRTLGEEYCDLAQVESATGALPAISRRAAYIAGSILAPYGITKALPKIRARIRARLQQNLGIPPTGAEEEGQDLTPAKLKARRTWSYKFQSYLLANLTSITSPAPIHAVGLALFYFSGSYYELAKRLTGLRYIFTHKVGESTDRAGYELLGVLLVVQMAVQSYIHVRSTLATLSPTPIHPPSPSLTGDRRAAGPVTVSLDHMAYSSNNELLLGGTNAASTAMTPTRIDIASATHTPALPGGSEARYDLANPDKMRWVKGAQQRKCTLCLEELKDPAATQCGHVFCWACIGDWVREKPECPLCRREALVQHILPLRAV